MNKSILTIDTPNVCIDCPCHFAGESGMMMCGVEKRELLSDDIETYKAEWCPLKEQKADRGGWITCSDRLPEEHNSMFAKFKGTEKWDSAMFEKISDDVNVTVEFENGKRETKTLHTVDGKWNGGQRGVKFKVIAWQSLPEEYHE